MTHQTLCPIAFAMIGLTASGCGGGLASVTDLGEPRVIAVNNSTTGPVDFYIGPTVASTPIALAPINLIHSNVAMGATTASASLAPTPGQFQVVFTQAGSTTVRTSTFVTILAYQTGTFTLSGAGTSANPYTITPRVVTRQ